MKRILFYIFIGCTSIAIGQEKTSYNSLGIDFFGGVISEHDSSLEKAIQGNPFGVLLSYNYVKPESSKFNNLYNYPERGYSLLYENFNSDILGEIIAGYRHFNYRLNPKRKDNLYLTTGFGLAYTASNYDVDTNPDNFAHGSNFMVSAFIKFQYLKWLLNDQIQLNSGVSLIHFSNMGFKNPNLGSNTIAVNVGLKYLLEEVSHAERNTLLKSDITDKKWHYGFVLRGGYNESREPNSGLYPFYAATIYAHKKINHYSNFVAGLDYSNAEFLEHYIPIYNEQEKTNYSSDLTQRAGIFIGHELTQNNFALVTQIGYTFYYPFPYISPIYERFGFKYSLGEHLIAEVTMKVNLFRAEGLEFGLGYQF